MQRRKELCSAVKNQARIKDIGDAETILMTSENLKSAIRDMDPLYWTNQ